MELTPTFRRGMGARVSYKKCVFLANKPDTRQHLRQTRWGESSSQIPVHHHTRDLGAHFNCANKRLAGTLNGRFAAAGTVTQRIGRLPRPLHAIG